MPNVTPMMRQYLEIKEKYNDCILFFRLGDFYEMFFEDAQIASRELDLVLTGKDCGLNERAPMCGVPFHSADTYVTKLIEKGFKVAICEQLEDPSLAKGLVERDVIRIITPGTVIEDKILDNECNNYIASVFYSTNGIGLAYSDVSTGIFCLEEFIDTTFETDFYNEIIRVRPAEIIASESFFASIALCKKISSSFYINKFSDKNYNNNNATKILVEHFKVNSLKGFGCDKMSLGVAAAGALLFYLEDTQKNSLSHIKTITVINNKDYLFIDASTRRNLELTVPLQHDGNKKNTLLFLLNECKTAMGSRLLHDWVDRPLQKCDLINYRLDAVDYFQTNPIIRSNIRQLLNNVYDIERLCSKIVYGSINARDCISLKNTLLQIPLIFNQLSDSECEPIKEIYSSLDPMDSILELIHNSIVEEPPPTIRDGGFIKSGFNDEVDRLHAIQSNSKQLLSEFEEKERENTGIKKLRIGYNHVFGYYIEVTKSNYDQIPDRYIRKQTLANAERYITEELKEMEETILNASQKLLDLELSLFACIREKLFNAIETLQNNARFFAVLDCYQSLAEVASTYKFVRPVITDSDRISIVRGRHPVVEASLHSDFVPNDTFLDSTDNRLLIITGPNMAGKSTYMRQVAIITLLAHIGSFVPAESAEICIVDRIFTRIGASDDLATGQSTFMVEMSEMANIINNATSKSLLIIDEIGRGTSTFDGLSIAWAILEHLADSKKCGAKTLFSTHYHELTELEGKIDGVKNYQVTVKEYGDDIIFLRKIVRGSGDKSFGIQVAKLAGLPEEILLHSKQILTELEQADINQSSNQRTKQYVVQYSLFDTDQQSALERILDGIDPDSLTPKEALEQIYVLKALSSKDK